MAGPILALLGVAVIFNCMVTVTNGILQAHGKVNIPIYTTLVGGLVNIITDYILIGMGAIHIYGAAIATIAYCAVIMFLNVIAMHKTMDLPPRILKQFVKPMIATALMAVAAYLTYEAAWNLLDSTAFLRSRRYACGCGLSGTGIRHENYYMGGLSAAAQIPADCADSAYCPGFRRGLSRK